nr:hypothetical protein [Haloquadratum walsbyi]
MQRLVEQDLLEEGRACGRKYYTVLPAGRELLGQKLKVGPGQGDIGEKTPYLVAWARRRRPRGTHALSRRAGPPRRSVTAVRPL